MSKARSMLAEAGGPAQVQADGSRQRTRAVRAGRAAGDAGEALVGLVVVAVAVAASAQVGAAAAGAGAGARDNA